MRSVSALVAACLALALVGCAETAVEPDPTASSAATTSAAPASSAVASPTPSPSPTVSLPADSEFPITFLVARSLIDGGAAPVIAELHNVAQGLPVLKVDITKDEARLTALTPDNQVVSYAWRDGSITKVDSDIQYLGQATFDPADYPLDNVARMFDVADLRGVRGTTQSLQIVEYRAGEVLMTVTSRPETSTVFFRQDGTAVAELGFTSVADITAGLEEVVGDATKVYQVGFTQARGYWADIPDSEDGVILNRSRTGGLPAFETRRSETSALATFSPSLLQPAALAKAVALFQASPDEPCDVVIDMSQQRYAPVATITCGSTVHYTDMDGRDMTNLLS